MNYEEISSADPMALFQEWMKEAEASERNDPNAVALATASRGGAPSVRMVLLKSTVESGFCFFTNDGSEKGLQLTENPQAAMCFHWKSLRRQVRVEGSVSDLPSDEVDRYFHSRSRRSQLGAAVSLQSRPLESRVTAVCNAPWFRFKLSVVEFAKRFVAMVMPPIPGIGILLETRLDCSNLGAHRRRPVSDGPPYA